MSTILPQPLPLFGIPLYMNYNDGLTYGYDCTLNRYSPLSPPQVQFIQENYLFDALNCNFIEPEPVWFKDPQEPIFYQRFAAFLQNVSPLCRILQPTTGPSTSSALAPTSRQNIPGPSTTTRKTKTRRAAGKAEIVGAPTVPLARRKGRRTPTQDKDPQEWPLLCPIAGCPQRTRDRRDMKRHLDSEKHKEKGFSCEPYGCNCGRRFTRDDAVKRHVKNKGFIV
ncbi:unnamed protein product [Cyclocybe aegerita]|uniref:C2H2-type domain-containing protein n=1 Tax=Cyclocybe aegerita TaxID=1973307 RepID=A0A8S0VYX7_CYCAE|nr:unnamed protein product [Cyclocybe aegerita]